MKRETLGLNYTIFCNVAWLLEAGRRPRADHRRCAQGLLDAGAQAAEYAAPGRAPVSDYTYDLDYTAVPPPESER